MEDVLDVYQRPYDPKRPQVCLDEASKQLIGETRCSVPMAPGQPAREDYEYVRNGTANLFMMFEPLAGKRHVKVTERRTRKDWAWCVKELVDDCYPRAERIDNAQEMKLEVSAWQDATQPEGHESGLAIHQRRRADQTQTALPINRVAPEH